jgi:pimeloyl-ACP methyl ester carboxylesterase
LANLPAADLYVSLNAHQGRPEVLTDWMDASATDESDPLATDADLDPFDRAHGPPYSTAFIDRYRAAQRRRNQRITHWAKAELERLNAAGTPDRIFPLFRCWGDLRFMDPAIDPSDRPPGRCYRGDPATANKTPSIGRANSLRTWLSMWSLETSLCRGEPHLSRIDVPALVVQGLADVGVFPSDARAIFGFLGSTDKSLKLVKGAHYFEDSIEERTSVADLMAAWIKSRSGVRVR